MSPPIGSLGTLSSDLSIFASFDWTDDEEADCKARWKPWTWDPIDRSKDLWPFSTAFVHVSVGGSAPDISGNLTFHADTYYNAFWDCGLDSTLEAGAEVTYKTWIESRCKCLKIDVDASADATQRSNLGGTGTTLAAMAAVYWGATWALPAAEEFARRIGEYIFDLIPPDFAW